MKVHEMDTGAIDKPSPRALLRPSWRRRLAAALAGLVLVLGAAYLIAWLTTEHHYWSRVVVWRDAAFDDFATKFEARAVPNGSAIVHLDPGPSMPPPGLETVTLRRNNLEQAEPLPQLLKETETRAFLIVKSDRLLYEGYFNGADRSSTMTSFSVAKSFLSALIGAAIADGKIGLDEPITRYLPELAGHPGLHEVRVRHLLAMASGLHYNGTGSGGGPFGDDARAYYDPDLRSLALTVKAEVPPGVRWQYNNFHPLLLGIILERATSESVSAYLSDKIWKPLGMEAPGSWSLDSRHDGFEKMESGLNGRAVDFAKFGMLYLHRGILQGREIVPPSWVTASTQHDPSVAGPSTSPAGEEWARALDYGYLWWIDPKAPGRFFAMGNFGQVIYVAPDRDAVLVRFGASYGNIAWIPILRDLASRLPTTNQARD
jgi:CubicO group peptidase (beta-lactamase class C family)